MLDLVWEAASEGRRYSLYRGDLIYRVLVIHLETTVSGLWVWRRVSLTGYVYVRVLWVTVAFPRPDSSA